MAANRWNIFDFLVVGLQWFEQAEMQRGTAFGQFHCWLDLHSMHKAELILSSLMPRIQMGMITIPLWNHSVFFSDLQQKTWFHDARLQNIVCWNLSLRRMFGQIRFLHVFTSMDSN